MTSSLLPENSTIFEKSMESVSQRLDGLSVLADQVFNPNSCPSILLPWLAYTFSVNPFNSSWPEKIQRATIARSFEVHKLKGTVGSVKKALAPFGATIQMKEWWQQSPELGDPHTFLIDIVAGSDTANEDKLKDLMRVLNEVKPVRSHYTLSIGFSIDTEVAIGATISAYRHTRLRFRGE